jgi:N-acetylmuramoyl-L-alanine amidase
LIRFCKILALTILLICLTRAGTASSPLASPVHLKIIKEGIVREGPAPYYKVAETLPISTEIKAVDKSGDWYLVKTPSGRIGWINAEAVTPISAPANTIENNAPKPPTDNNNVTVQLRLTEELEVTSSGFLMAGPSTTEEIIANLSTGLRVKKLDTEGDWYKIELPIGLVGWAHAGLFPEIKAETPPESTVVQSKLMKNGNLRQKPTRNAGVLATLQAGTVVTVIDSTTNWYKITTPDGQTGWMNYLLFDTKSPATPVTKPATKSEIRKTLTRNGNLREAHSLNAAVIKVVQAGTAVTVLDSIPNWYKVRLPDQTTGWINTIIFQ